MLNCGVTLWCDFLTSPCYCHKTLGPTEAVRQEEEEREEEEEEEAGGGGGRGRRRRNRRNRSKVGEAGAGKKVV